MNNNGFYISELRITGVEKEDAIIKFNKGLNVITGPSDTGKSYIYQCINYMFGSSSTPKEIEESEGYDTLYLEISKYGGEVNTLKRSLSDSDIRLYRCKIENISGSTKSQKLKSKHNAERDDNISSYFLELTGIDKLRIRKNQQGKTQSFSFRNLVKMIMLSEEDIISESSPILSGRSVSKTAEISAFRTIMTGTDDSDCYEMKDDKIYKSKIKGKLEIIEDLVTEIENDNDDKIELIKEESLTLEEIDDEIGRLTDVVTYTKNQISNLMNDKRKLWIEKQEIDSRIIMLQELIERFNLLEKSYISDLERLEFITEGGHYLSQLFDVNCPLCDNQITSENYEFIKENSDIKVNQIKEGCLKEKGKINTQLKDLRSTIETLQAELNERKVVSIKNKELIKELEEQIENKLKPISIQSKTQLNKLIESKNIIKELKNNKIRLDNLIKRREILNEQLDKEVTKVDYSNEMSDIIYQEFCNKVKNLLNEWKFADIDTVTFDRELYDLIISGKKKKSYGKGYRAIFNSTFLISIMNYVRDKNLKHPGLIVLDSPLTTFKDKDKKEKDEDIVNSKIKQKFYESLSKLKDDKQIIILENVEPTEKIIRDIQYIHFTKLNNEGRYGFFPIK